MQNHSKARLAGLLLAAGLGGNVFASPTTNVWICAITTGIACYDDGTTGAAGLEGLAQPTFMRIDAGAKQVTLLAPTERRGEVSQLDTVRQIGQTWLLSGVEYGRAWNMIITEDGYMTLSATADGIVWSVFGRVVGEDELRMPARPDGK